MNALLSVALWLALIMSSCCGHVAGHKKEKLTTSFSDADPSPTAMFDYYDSSHTVDYANYPEAERYIPNKASGIGQRNLLLLLGLAVCQIWS